MKKQVVLLALGTVAIALAINSKLHKEPAKAKASTVSSITYSKEYQQKKEEEIFGVDTHQEMPDIYSLECVGRKYVIDVTDDDIDLMVRVVMSEGSLLSDEGKQAIAETIINRVLSTDFPNNVFDVIFEPNAFSTSNNGAPTMECYYAVINALEFHAFPETMLYFRAGKYHDFAYPYMQIGNTYFSTTDDLRIIE